MIDAETRNERLPRIPAWLLTGGALLLAALSGRFMADGRMKYGAAIAIAACYLPLVLFDLAAAVAVWIGLQFFEDLRVLSFGPNAIGVLLVLGWFGAFMSRGRRSPVLREHRKLFLAIVLFLVWGTLTIVWSTRSDRAATQTGYYWLSALAFLIVASTVVTARDVRFIVLAFIIGAAVSVMIGLATGSLKAADTTVTQTALQGRFTGGGGDPNVQAAGFVASMFLIVGLFSVYRSRTARWLLVIAFALVSVGFITAQSRGGLIALGVATLFAVLLAPRLRRRILGLMAIAAITIGVLLTIRPDALQRIVDLGGGTSGRSDVWSVTWRVFTSHPFFGVGLGNLQTFEPRFVLLPGSINRIQFVSDTPYLAHNTYLQLLAEAGIVGLAAFIVVIVISLRACGAAIARLEEQGRSDYADLARTVLLGTVGMLTAMFFISDGEDYRLWVLLALGPVLLTMARQLAGPPVPGSPGGPTRRAQPRLPDRVGRVRAQSSS